MTKARRTDDLSSFGNNESTDPYEGCVGLVYARVSTKRQEEEGSGLQSQEGRCVKDLKAINIPFEKSFLDSYSGGGDFMRRPAMRALLTYIDCNPHKRFVVEFDDLKRFARDVEFHLKLRAAFKARGVLLRCLNYNFEESPEGRFSETVMAAHAELERHQNRRQVVQKMKARLEAGYWTFGTKKGYTMVKDPHGHGMVAVPNAEGLEMLKPAMEGFANGTLQRKIDVCRFLVDKGFWRTQTPDRYIDKLTVFLKDPFYVGDIEYSAWEVARRPAKHQALISVEVFDKIQKRLNRDGVSTRVRQDISVDFPLRGLLVCSACGRHITGAWTKGRSRKYPYYYCQNRHCELYSQMNSKETVETAFYKLLKENSLKAEVGNVLTLVFDRVWKEEMSEFDKREGDIQIQITDLETKEDSLTDAVLNAKSVRLGAVYETRLEKVAIQLEELRALTGHKRDLTTPYRTALEKATCLVKSPYSIWQTLDVVDQRVLFFFLFEDKLSYSKNDGYRTADLLSTARLFEEFAIANSHDVEVRRVELRSEPCFKSESTTRSYYLNFSKSVETIAKPLLPTPVF